MAKTGPTKPKAQAGAVTGTQRCVVLLRGVNVSGKNRLPMPTLCGLLEQLGCRSVRTYIQSGNAVVNASPQVARGLQKALSAAIDAELGLRVPVVVRTGAELEQLVKANPFLKAREDSKPLHVAFLQSAPSAASGRALDPDRSPPDRFALRGRELYLHLPNGVGKSKLTSDYLDRTLGTVCTIRNWNTVLALSELVELATSSARSPGARAR